MPTDIEWADDSQGYPLVFWAKGFQKLCATCATEILDRGGKVLVYFTLHGGSSQCSACFLPIESEEMEGDGDCDAETANCEDDPMKFEDWQMRHANTYNFDPTNSDWEEDRADREPDDENSEDGGEGEPDEDGEWSPACVQNDWEQFEVGQ